MGKNKHKGSCFCGEIKFEIIDTGGTVAACHCVDCRKSSGAPFMVFVVVESRCGHFVRTVGQPSLTRIKMTPIQ